MATLFVSDVHLSSARPQMVAAFLSFLDQKARHADSLYVLGDLFDVWLGDDDDRAPHPEIVEALARLTESGLPVSVLPGNHDFLIGEEFARHTGCALLPDHQPVDVHGIPVLLMHGDTLCTRDVDYQEFRKWARDPDNQSSRRSGQQAATTEAQLRIWPRIGLSNTHGGSFLTCPHFEIHL